MIRRIVTIILPLLIIGCSHPETIQEKASRLVFANYRDCEKIVYMNIDTVTFGDNLEYRISQADNDIQYKKGQVQLYKDYIKEFKRYGSSAKRVVDGYQIDLQKADSALTRAFAWRHALDSLKQATLDISTTATAYTINVQYNYVGNMVWVQLAEDGTFLAMSKRQEDLLLNPGEDMPGYFDLYMKYHK